MLARLLIIAVAIAAAEDVVSVPDEKATEKATVSNPTPKLTPTQRAGLRNMHHDMMDGEFKIEHTPESLKADAEAHIKDKNGGVDIDGELEGDEHILHNHEHTELDDNLHHDHHAAKIYNREHHEHMDVLKVVGDHREKMGDDKHDQLLSLLMQQREEKVRTRPGDHPDDYKAHEIAKHITSDREMIKALHGHDEEKLKAKIEHLQEVHGKKYGHIMNAYSERVKAKADAQNVLYKAKQMMKKAEEDARQAEWEARSAAAQAKTEFEPLEPTIDLGGNGNEEDAMDRLEDELERDGLMDDPMIKKAVDAAQASEHKLRSSYNSTRTLFIIVSSFLAVIIIFFGFILYMISDGKDSHKADQIRKAAAQTRMGNGIRVNHQN